MTIRGVSLGDKCEPRRPAARCVSDAQQCARGCVCAVVLTPAPSHIALLPPTPSRKRTRATVCPARKPIVYNCSRETVGWSEIKETLLKEARDVGAENDDRHW